MPEKRRLIFELIKKSETISIDEIVEELELSKNATRLHLTNLEESGFIEKVKVEVEQRGRPPSVYRVSPSGQSLFPKSEGEVLSTLLQFLEEKGAHDLLQSFFEELWEERQKEYEQELSSQNLSSQDIKSRVSALEKVLERGGFLPVIQFEHKDEVPESREKNEEREVKSLLLRECNCPFPAIVRVTQLPCQLELEFLSRIIGFPPCRVKHASPEQSHCLYEFEFKT